MRVVDFGNVTLRFRLRNRLGNSGLHLQIVFLRDLLTAGLWSCLVALVLKVLKRVALLHTCLGNRLHANRIRLLSCIPYIGFFRAVLRKIASLLERWSLQLCWLYIRLLKYRQSKLSLMTYERHRDGMLGTNKV